MASPTPIQPNMQAGNEKREAKSKYPGRGGHSMKDIRPVAATPVDPISRPEAAQQSQDQQPRDQQSHPNPSPAAQPFAGRGRGGRATRNPGGRGEVARHPPQVPSQPRQGSGGGNAPQGVRGPPGLSGQRANATNESTEQGGTGSSSGPQAFPTMVSAPATGSTSADQQGESVFQLPPAPPALQASAAAGGSSRHQQQGPARNGAPGPRPALTPTQTGIRHNPSFPGGEGAKTYVLNQPANTDHNHEARSNWMEVTPNNANPTANVIPQEGLHQQLNPRLSGGGGPVTAPGVPPQGSERRGGQAGNGASAARAARADSDSINAALQGVGAHASNGARGAVGVVQLLAPSVGSSGAAGRQPPPTPAVRLPYSPNPHHVFPDDVTTPQSANIAAVAAHAAESTPAQRTQLPFNPAPKQAHGQHNTGGYAPITHSAKQTGESAMPFAASGSMSTAVPVTLAIPIPLAMPSSAALGGVPVRGFSTLLNPSAVPFGKVPPSGVAVLQDIEGVAFEKADSQDLRSNANKIRAHIKERSVLEQQHAKVEQDILTEITRMEVEADKQAHNQRALAGVTKALEESRKECAEVTAILAGKDAELAKLAAQLEQKEIEEDQIMSQLKNKDTQAWVLQNESDELRTKMEELETNSDNANAKNEGLSQALDAKHAEFLCWYNAYHTGEAVANEKIAVLDAHVKDLEAQLRMKDGVIPRQDSNFSGLHNEQQQMQFGQHFPGPTNGHMTDQQQQQQQAVIGSSAQTRPVPPGFQAPMFGQATAGGGMDPAQQQQHQMHSMLQHPASQQQQHTQGSFDGSGGPHMGQQQYGVSGQLGEASAGGAGGFPPMFQPGFQTNMRPHPHTLFNRTLNANDLIEKFSELIPDSSAQAVTWGAALDAELDKKLAPHTWAGHYASTWGAPTFFLQQHSGVFAGRPDKSFYRIAPLYTHQGGLSHGGSSGAGGGNNNNNNTHPGGMAPSVIPGISLQPLPGLPGMNVLYANQMAPQPNFGYGYSNN